MKKKLYFALSAIMILLSITGCQNGKKPVSGEPFDLTKIIESTTGSYLIYNSPIIINLRDNTNICGKKGTAARELEFIFEPSIRGKAEWQDEKTIYYLPKDDLIANRTYNCTILPAGRSEQDSLVVPVKFSFQVISQSVEDFECGIDIADAEEKQFRLKGKIKFLSDVSLKTLNKAAVITYEGKKKKLDWLEIGNKSYSYESGLLDYSQGSSEIEFLLQGNFLDLPYDIYRSFDAGEESILSVVQINMINLEDNPYIEIEFSSSLDKAQDFSAFVHIDPEIPFNTNVTGNIIRVWGKFAYNEPYTLSLDQDIRSDSKKTLKKPYSSNLVLTDIKPVLEFSDSGSILTGSSDNNIYFKTINVKQVHYEITRVYENNLCQYFQEWDIRESSDTWNYYRLNRVGKTVAEGVFDLGLTKNIWLQHELNISKLLPRQKFGIYVIKLSMKKEDILYVPNELVKGDSYYDDPLSHSYYYRFGTRIKPVVVSDLAITYKRGTEDHLCLVTNVLTGKPWKDAFIKVLNFQNQVISEGFTNKEGFYNFVSTEQPFFVTARSNLQENMLKLSGNQWQTSRFDTRGSSAGSKKLRAYIYTERGVYRPGDEINISIIMRNQDGTFPDNHPLTVEIFDPRQTKIMSNVLKNGVDGFYHLPYATSPDDPTGSWNLRVKVGENTFDHELRIETITPERLKLNFSPEYWKILPEHRNVEITLETRYLFGRPASGLKAKIVHHIQGVKKKFEQPEWKEFSFHDAMRNLSKSEPVSIEAILDDHGKTSIIWERPEDDNFNASGILKVTATVAEAGGRASEEAISLYWDPWQAYVGIKATKVNLDDPEKIIELILLDPDGIPIGGENLNISIYESKNYWWLEYDSFSDFQRHYKQSSSTRLVEQKMLLSANTPLRYQLPQLKSGNILVEVTHLPKEGKGNTSSLNIAGSWNRGHYDSIKQEDLLSLELDKEEYYPGETAKLRFTANDMLRTLVTLEKADKILDWWWYDMPAGRTMAEINIAVTKNLTPGAYATISAIQPQKEKQNDCPLRMYGIIPIKVTDKATIIDLKLTTPEIIRPGEKFSCQVQADPGKNAQFTISVVDEGLLSLTKHLSPDPWQFFNQKEKLDVITCDNFAGFIDINQGDIYQRFAIGGGMEYSMDSSEFGKRQLEKTEIKRFEPVSLFSGILKADKNGKAEAEFFIPDYLGAVRIMAVCASGNRFGAAHKSVTVRKELMMIPTLPRALAPGDKIFIPVEIFAFNDKIIDATVSINTSGPLKIISESEKKITLNDNAEALVIFEAEMENAITPVKVSTQVNSNKYEHLSVINIPVRPLQPYHLASQRSLLNPGDKAVLDFKRDAVIGTESSRLVFSRPGYFQYNKHFKYLVRYPYGCLEQSVSALFPQLFIAELIEPDMRIQLLGDINFNIQQGLRKLTKYQNSQGGYSYWRGEFSSDPWSSVYTTHFLTEAKAKGYDIPAAQYEKALDYLKKNGLSGIKTIEPGLLKIQVYQLYLLARAGEPQLNQMNYLLQNQFDMLDNCDRWLLAGSYYEAGQIDISKQIASQAGRDANTKTENFYKNYGSLERDRAIILAIATHLGHEDIIRTLFTSLSQELNSDRYYSTQSRAFMLWALSSYAAKHAELFSTEPVKGRFSGYNTPEQSFHISDNSWLVTLDNPKDIEIYLDEDSAPAEFTLYYDRVPAEPVREITNEIFSVSRSLNSSRGKNIGPDSLKQGESYDLEISIHRHQPIEVKNLALTQILPSGWEIVNMRLDGDNSYNKNADYTDIRDDRILWFFDYQKHSNNTKVFKVKVRAVTAGEFEMPPTLLEAMYLPDFTVITPGEKIMISR
jgi:alpha-2-macroglobulin